uniref:Uncharacterized protein n=1 Tax=Arundo donax TaxID=35708 RepID=A0A0A9CA18_ARUDO
MLFRWSTAPNMIYNHICKVNSCYPKSS